MSFMGGLVLVKCPFCGKEMLGPIDDTLDVEAWGCIDCEVKLYKRKSQL